MRMEEVLAPTLDGKDVSEVILRKMHDRTNYVSYVIVFHSTNARLS